MSLFEILLGVTVLGWVLLAIASKRAKYDTELWPNGCKICGADRGCNC